MKRSSRSAPDASRQLTRRAAGTGQRVAAPEADRMSPTAPPQRGLYRRGRRLVAVQHFTPRRPPASLRTSPTALIRCAPRSVFVRSIADTRFTVPRKGKRCGSSVPHSFWRPGSVAGKSTERSVEITVPFARTKPFRQLHCRLLPLVHPHHLELRVEAPRVSVAESALAGDQSETADLSLEVGRG
jgi:hypothetical protein